MLLTRGKEQPEMVMLKKIMALGALCTMFAAIGSTAQAQFNDRRDNYRDWPMSRREALRRLDYLHRAYSRDVEMGDRQAAERDHRRAQMIRARLRGEWQSGGWGSDWRDRQ
jgi:hypothetical protein